MDEKGRGRASLAQMCSYMKNLQRKVEDLTNVLYSQRIMKRDVFDEETNQ
jgi:hypothetical protein